MHKTKKIMARVFSMAMAILLAVNMTIPAFAEVIEQPINSETVENVEPTQTSELAV